MYSVLTLIETTTSAKLDHDDVERNLDILWTNMGQMEGKDDMGNIIWQKPNLIRATLKLFDTTYALMIQKLETKGILTKQSEDPRHAMGKFGSS